MLGSRILIDFTDSKQRKADNEEIFLATLICLPFHLCTGKYYQFLDPNNPDITIWLHNQIYFPFGTPLEKAITTDLYTEKAFTEAILINFKPAFSKEELKYIRNRESSKLGPVSISNPALDLLNEFIVIHGMMRIGPVITSGQNILINVLSFWEFINSMIVEAVVITPKNIKLLEEHINHIFERVHKIPRMKRTGGIGDIIDFSEKQLSEADNLLIRLRKHAFYELAFKAKTAKLGGDSIVAILLACASLEGAHATFLRVSLDKKLSDYTGNKEELIQNLLREQGIHTLVRITPYLFMDKVDRPSTEHLDLCIKGITIRNDIMHSKIRKMGEYKLREYSESDLNNAYGGIMRVYASFVKAIEKVEGV